MADRLQKILARAGVAARRKAEELIVAGRVRVDGHVVTELGTKADLRRQKIELDGKRVIAEPFVYVLLHKPRGTVCTASDPEGRITVTSLVRGVPGRLVPIGRLDYATSGVLLLSNDGDFSMGLVHPKRKVEKVYVAKVQGEVTEDKVERFKQSIVIDGKPTKPINVRVLRIENRKTWLELTLEEGKNRQIRRLGEAIGYPVLRLARTHFADITIEGLRPGDYRLLTMSELRDLQKKYGVPKRLHSTDLELPKPSKKPFHLRPEGVSSRGRASGGTGRLAQRARSEATDATGERSVRGRTGAEADRSDQRGRRDDVETFDHSSRGRTTVGEGRSTQRSRGNAGEAAEFSRSGRGRTFGQRERPLPTGSSKFAGSDQSDWKKPAARTKAKGPRMGSADAASMPRSKTMKSGTSMGKDKARKRPSGPFAVTTPNKRSRRSGSG